MSFEKTQARVGSAGAATSDATMAAPGKRTQVQLAEAQIAQHSHAAPSLADVRAGHGVLKVGEQGAAVTHVQHLLHVHASGVFDENTRFAVEKFQHGHGLPASGAVDQKTLEKLEQVARAHHHHHGDGGGGGGGGGGGSGVVSGGGAG